MYLKLVLSIALLATVSCNDIEQGQNVTEARKIFDEKREASPAVWKQVDRVTVNTTDAEAISRVVVTDLRPNKDGEANIVDGGEGNQTVTIELKSPTVLRGYEFHIEVYAVPDTKAHDISTPAVIANDKPKDQWKTSEDDLRLNIGDVKPPSSFGADSPTKKPEHLSRDLKVNDGKRVVRDTEGKKVETATNHHLSRDLIIIDGKRVVPDTEGKKVEPATNYHLSGDSIVIDGKRVVRDTEGKKGETATNHPIAFVDPKESSNSDLTKKIPVTDTKYTETDKSTGLHQADTPQKSIETSTHLPTTVGHDFKQKDDHERHARDTLERSTTQAPSTSTKAVNDSNDDFPEMIYPQWQVNKMTENTDKLIPVEPLTNETKEVKSKKDDHSTSIPSSTTTSTSKPRAVRDTEATTPKNDLKDKAQEDDKHIQKIPSSGLVTIPKEWTDLQNKTAPKTNLDKSEDSKTQQQAPLFPSFNQEPAKNGPAGSSTAKSVKVGHPSSSDESESSESSESVKPIGFSTSKPSGF